ncbi:MAG: bifunctional UDP-N-acetylglucosamine diphosphorylase/glucosamine-1-phosphate N-acetyltransferase GlmU [Polaromonas sp.]|uniref:bifunctional UDP-N-acetylglucosamine diphosphorylase/glucosamine-1-phosphate N-acetyltransferase GlmU n=1 Tax=Polaromonas sp. TaxID=1869339 RepID=UPI0027321715|nr:bifunctional UDP-N-acetylglucosamine diphosphorylase/glucosamine-1-phosphate N-acetyltransferase GlmU [Polaromonas sp.]MDP2449289.1 bifunctional UDP-N-acetylglucosamine diphosphorylase/glucosamine-1-phosphate N-acetyltransferase GlmU [Polaromonas sp.]MDP3245516.1 bifunctional UDP-N-acetylglucosamine diphosphorylase/glucosamine-1-phosphate N-acetyltransferase GlmU [Polaromonas sp.]MDP3754694.1 bifunctional UDP-N-acetylglucosamine diphosphorylase/glucosamine-1-phosphate N-acetyltransferase GlmU
MAIPVPVDVVIMAAGKGTRMKSALPKVLHRLGGRALLAHVIDCATRLSARQAVVITGHGAAEVESACNSMTQAAAGLQSVPKLQFARQEPQLGTGHAVQQALPLLADDGVTLVLSGDVPLTQVATLQALLAQCDGQRLALLTLSMADPTGYGRIARAGAEPSAQVRAIVEHKDATDAQREIREIYSGIMAVPTRLLRSWLARLDNKNAQNEYYLTDIVKFAVADGVAVVAHQITDAAQVAGVNSPVQLAELERVYQLRQATALMEQGVRISDPARFDVRGSLACGQDVDIDVNCVFEGRVSLGDDVRIGANCCIANATIAAGAVIHPFTHIDGEKLGVQVGEGALIGPFARLRPGAQLGAEVHIGNFVEVKNSTLARGAKANHLAYLGDATVGERVNYGAGSITANYDGANKHRTVIEADVHIGSNCVLVAPVTIGAGGTVGGGSTITKDTPPGALSVARGKQVNIANWQRPVKNKTSA